MLKAEEMPMLNQKKKKKKRRDEFVGTLSEAEYFPISSPRTPANTAKWLGNTRTTNRGDD